MSIECTIRGYCQRLAQMTGPRSPSRPLPPHHTAGPAEWRAHADRVEAYEREVTEYEVARGEFRVERANLQELVRVTLRESHPTMTDAQFLYLWNYSEQKSDSGYWGIYEEFENALSFIEGFRQRA